MATMACNSSRRLDHNFTYFQHGLDSIEKLKLSEPVIRPNDLLSIQVFSNSLNQEQIYLYNVANGFGPGVMTNAINNPAAQGFLVNENGDIIYPSLGKLHAAGLTVLQLKNIIEHQLDSIVKKPEVLIRFLNFKVDVLGEVRNPGPKIFNNQRVTIIDALSAAGDLTDQGKRDNILIFREENGQVKHYTVDMRGANNMFNSPVFQLQQNDMIYVSPNDIKLKSVKRNPNVDRDLQLTLSFVSIAAFMITIINALKGL
jgi:polysaccharide export outer membrane protein